MRAVIFFLMIMAVFLSYSPALLCSYLRWDDGAHILQNIHVYRPLDLWSLHHMFTSFINETYVPLTSLSFNIQFHTVGLSPFVTHIVNVLGHLLVCALVYLFFLQLDLGPAAALIGTSLFALHPMHVESVVWATERKDILCAVFYLIALNAYIKYQTTSAAGWYVVAFAAGALSILSKAMAVSLPWVLLLLDFYRNGRVTARNLNNKIPFALFIFPIAALTFFKLGGHPALTFPGSPLILCFSAAFYIQKFFWPHPLLALYAPSYPIALFNPPYLAALAALAAAGAALWQWRHHKTIVFGALFFLASIFFFFRVDLADINIVADRFIYLPSIGLCLIAGTLLARVHLAFTAAICLLLGVLTFNQAGVWHDDVSLWSHVLRHQPANAVAQKKYKETLTPPPPPAVDYVHFDALPAAKDRTHAYLRRGVSLVKDGHYQLALDDFNTAIALDPQLEEAYLNRGNVLAARGAAAAAMADYDQAIRINPLSTALLNKAILLGSLKQSIPAEQMFNKAIGTNNNIDRALYERGFYFSQKNNCDKAVADFTAALARNKSDINYFLQRGQCALSLNNFQMALSDFSNAIGLDPKRDDAYWGRCRAGNRTGNPFVTIKDCNRAIDLFGFDARYYEERAKANFLLGQKQDAVNDLDKVLQLDPRNAQAIAVRAELKKMITPK